jgi:hypothetical protein
MMRRILTAANGKIIAKFNNTINDLEEYDLTDIMLALAEQRGGTTPLYEAVEEATEELDDATVELQKKAKRC